MKKLIFSLFVAAVIVFLVFSLSITGCKKTTTEAETKAAETTAAETKAAETTVVEMKEFTIGYVPMGFGNPHFEHEKNGVLRAIDEEKDIKINYVELDGQWDPVKESDAMETLIGQKVDGILISPLVNEPFKPLTQEAHKKGIIVVALDVNQIGGEDGSVITDNFKAGQQVGEYVVDRLKGKGTFCILELIGNAEAEKRPAGFLDIVSKYPDMKLLARQDCKATMEGAMKVTETWLQKFSSIDCIFGVNDPSGLGALAAVEAAKRQDETFCVGVDGYEEGINAIREGRNYGCTAQQQPDKIGYEGAKIMIQLLKGETPEQLHIMIPTVLITKDNLDQSSF